MPDAETVERGEELVVAGIAGNIPAGGVLVSQRTEEVKDDAHSIDCGTRHCRCVF
jgi:hypothetical protein